MKTRSRFKIAKYILMFWCLFVGIGAMGGSACMLIDPSGKLMGMDPLLPYFQALPFADILFQDYVFPGFSLLIVNGLSNLTAAALLFAKKKSGIICDGIFGVTLMLWITIQFVIFPINALDVIYFTIGFLQAATGFAAYVFNEQENFSVNLRNYPNAGNDPTKLIVYFSRLGYTKKAAYEEAELTGATVYEVKATERTAGTLGFWWCGRFGMHRWDMPIEPPDFDISAFEHVTICSPVWVFGLSAPMRSFCRFEHGKIKAVDYVLVHFQNIAYKYIATEIDSLLGINGGSLTSICSRHGKQKKCTKIELKTVETAVNS